MKYTVYYSLPVYLFSLHVVIFPFSSSFSLPPVDMQLQCGLKYLTQKWTKVLVAYLWRIV